MVGDGFQPRGGGNVGGYAQKGGTRTSKCLHFYGRQIRVAGVA